MKTTKNDQLGDRMKAYESSFKAVLPRRVPLIIRVDGKAFHTYTRSCEKPFDMKLQGVMNDVATALCQEIQGAQFAYVQSDEISVLVHNYKKLNTSPWFDNQVQKIVSISASIASTTFTMNSWKIFSTSEEKVTKRALFDSRVFIIPENDVCNYFVWRQKDAIRNSIQMVARSMISHKLCENKSSKDLIRMLSDRGVKWDNIPNSDKFGRTIVKQEYDVYHEGNPVKRSLWVTNFDTPVFSEQRSFVDDYLKIDSSQE